MSDATLEFRPSLKSLGKSDWIDKASEMLDGTGNLLRLGDKHLALYKPGSTTLLVTFETLQGIQALSPLGQPLGWHAHDTHGWSQLSLISDGDTWFRDPDVFSYFDEMVDDCFFDGFDHVIFYGAGPCGYAACAYSVVSPGARVLAVQPQATLDPRLAGWDQRFTEQRRVSFTDRYGYAPDMLEAASRAYVIFDPAEMEDAMHAALFNRPNVTLYALRNMGAGLQSDLLQMCVLHDLIETAARGRLTPARFARFARARRDHKPYLRRLMGKLVRDDRDHLASLLCNNVSNRMNTPRFADRLKSMVNEQG